MTWFFVAVFFVFGTIIGSFLNVVIFRFNTSKSLGGRSACMSCVKKLSWYELIPILSFLLQSGRCRGCRARISAQYPSVEFVTGFLFALLFYKFRDLFLIDSISFFANYVYHAVLFSILIIISVYDIKHKIIPDVLVLVFGVVAFMGLFLFSNGTLVLHWPSVWDILTPIIASGVFGLMWLVSRGAWMGLGDAKLLLGLGFMLGASMFISALTLSFWIGAFFGILMISFKVLKGLKSEIPFAPFLVLGTTLAFFLELNLFIAFF